MLFRSVSAYGSTTIHTPNIDSLAHGGVCFMNGYATSATSTPSRYALMTGMYPWKNKDAKILPGDAPLIINENQFTLPKMMQQCGGKLTFQLKPFSFKHTGLFPEQAANWDWFSNLIQNANRPIKVLNLFAYTGGATLAAAAAGASVTHVDASKGMVAWAKENAASSGLSDRKSVV